LTVERRRDDTEAESEAEAEAKAEAESEAVGLPSFSSPTSSLPTTSSALATRCSNAWHSRTSDSQDASDTSGLFDV